VGGHAERDLAPRGEEQQHLGSAAGGVREDVGSLREARGCPVLRPVERGDHPHLACRYLFCFRMPPRIRHPGWVPNLRNSALGAGSTSKGTRRCLPAALYAVPDLAVPDVRHAALPSSVPNRNMTLFTGFLGGIPYARHLGRVWNIRLGDTYRTR
jgi:hypothetical protein